MVKIEAATISNYYRPIKLFCDVNDILVNWKFISRGISKGKHASDDRAPTLEEIHQLLKYPDIRIKPIVLTMLSSGIRIAAWDYLKWKHITPIESEEGTIKAAKIIVYAGDPEQYYSFITSEAYTALKNGWNVEHLAMKSFTNLFANFLYFLAFLNILIVLIYGAQDP